MTEERIRKHCKGKGYSDSYIDYWVKKPWCEICNDHGCGPHHIKSRGAGGSDEHENLITLCAYHHYQVHQSGWKTFTEIYPKLFIRFNRAMGFNSLREKGE